MAYFNIENFVSSEEPIERRSNANEMCFLCPLEGCDDTTGKFYVNRETLKYFCHKCHRGGGPLRKREGLKRPVPPAPLKKIRMPASYVEFMPRPKEMFHALIRQQTLVREFFKKRKFRWEDLQGWNLGYCKAGAFANRLIIPVYMHNKLVALQGRTLLNEKPKYKNLASHSVYTQIFYNWDRAIHYDNLVIVEGPFDAIRVGFNAIATMGTFLSSYRVNLLNSLYPKLITLMLDSDRAGRNGMYEATRKIFPSIEVKIAQLPKGKDPADLTREALLEILNKAKNSSLTNLFRLS